MDEEEEDKARQPIYIRENGKTLEDQDEKQKQKAHIHVPAIELRTTNTGINLIDPTMPILKEGTVHEDVSMVSTLPV